MDFRIQVRALCFVVILLGIAVLFGWALNISLLIRVLPGLASMTINTAIAFVLCGSSLWLAAGKPLSMPMRIASCTAAGLTVLIAGLTLAEHLLVWKSGLDELVYKQSLSLLDIINSGRMSIVTALMFLLYGISLILMTFSRHYLLIQFLALVSGLIALLPIGGYLFGNLHFWLFTGFYGVTVHTALGSLVMAIGILLATVQHGWIALLWPRVRPIYTSLSVIILLVSIAALIHNIAQSDIAVNAMGQTYRLLKVSQEVTSASFEHKAINRSYLLTGDDTLVEQALQIRQIILSKLHTLHELTADNPGRQRRMDQLVVKFNKLFASADRLIAVRREHGIEAAATMANEGTTDRLHAYVISELSDLATAEQSKLELQQHTVELRGKITQITLSTTLFFGTGVLLIAFNILYSEIRHRKRAERLEKSRSEVLELLACGASLSTVLDAIVLGVEKEHPAMLCSILLLDEAGKHLIHGAAPSLPEFYNQAIDGIEIGMGIGSCGTAAYTRQRIIVCDIQGHPYWAAFKELASKAGLASCWSEPILSSEGKALGTFAIYHADIHEPNPSHLQLIEQAAKLASVAIEKNLADRALKASEARYRDMFEANPQPMWMFDTETLAFLAADEAAIRHYGYSRDEFLSMDITDIQPQEDSLRFRQAVKEISKGPNQFGIWRHITKDGGEIQVEVTAQLLTFEGRKAVLMLANDVTERLRIEQQLRKLSMAVEQSPEGIVITDLRATIEYVNDAFVRNTGFSREEAIGQKMSLIKSGKTPAETYQQVWAALKQGQVWKGEFINKRKDGSEYVEASILIPIKDVQGMTTHYVDIQEDVTEKKKLNAELEQHRHHLEGLVAQRTAELAEAKADAEAANLAKSSFLSNMSHEIRTPMNAVLGFCYLLEHQPLPDESRGLVRKIHGAGKSLLTIINDILDFSKIEAGRLEIENQPFQLNDVLDSLAALMSASAESKHLELLIIPPLYVNHLLGDEMRLQQVLVNLLSNAIKFTEKGEVELRISVESEHGDQVQLRFSVRDTGIGISPEQQQAIFGAFSQADSSISRRFGGTGLGLAISQQLVAMMGGKLQLYSELGVGSEFWFELSLRRNSNDTQDNLQMHNLKLLIVDDCKAAREALYYSVISLGWQADIVDSGEAAVIKILANRSAPYDVLLVDWKMPGLDGLATAQALQGAFSEQQINARKFPIILMVTAYSQEELKEQPGIRYIDGLVSKPVTPSSLYDAVNKALRQDQAENEIQASDAHHRPGRRIPDIRVLVVDDSDINREVAKRILEAEGALVSQAGDGQEALDWLSVHTGAVDVVLMDIQMPRLDGYAATRAIRANPNFEKLPVLALTAGAFKNLQDAALEAGMNDFIAKPFNVDLLIQKIQHWSGHKQRTLPDEIALSRQNQEVLDNSHATSRQELPGIDLKSGLEIWVDVDTYRSYLSRFVGEYGEVAEDFINYAQAGDFKAIAALAHKLKGSSSSLALQTVRQRCLEIETAIENHESIITAANNLQKAIAEVADSLSIWTANGSAPAKASNEKQQIEANRENILSLLNELLAALNEDNPLHTKPIMTELEGLLNTETIASIKTQILNFDFRKAEDLTRELINNLNTV